MAGEWTGWLARFSSRRGTALGLVAAIALIDNSIHWGHFGFVLRGLIDVPCHAATGLILLGAITRWRGAPPGPRFTWGLLAGSVAIDVDHLPEEFGYGWWSAGTVRPHSHALWLVLVLAVIPVLAARRARAPVRRRAAVLASIAAGATWGVVAHLYRDAATAPVPLWWPLSGAGTRIPYLAYLLPMILLSILPPPRRHSGHQEGEDGEAEAVMSAVGSSGVARPESSPPRRG